MTATNHTEHYGLSQYTESVRPTYTGDYNGDMSKIDAAIYAASQAGGMATVEHTADLTGTQLDTQYSDNYNIVRVGTPTRGNEREEPHHE